MQTPTQPQLQRQSQLQSQRLSPATTKPLGPMPTHRTHRTRRTDIRVELVMPLYIRRPENSPTFRKEVETRNLSRNGVRIIVDVPLEDGALLMLYAFGKQFTGKAVVKHVERQGDGMWAIGLQFIDKQGKWSIV